MSYFVDARATDLVAVGAVGSRRARLWMRSREPGAHRLELWRQDHPYDIWSVPVDVSADPGLDGLIYDSVRRKEGQNVCIFRPGALPLPIVQGAHYEYAWDAGGALTILALTKVERRSEPA